MTQSGQTTLFYWPETTLGQLPASPPTGKRLRLISENLFVGPNLVDSPELVEGNEPEDQIENGFDGGGDVAIALSGRNYDDFIAAILWSSWADPAGSASTPVRTTGGATVTYAPATRTLTTSGTWTNTPAAGDKILVWGSSNAYLNGIHTVEQTSTPTSTDIILEQDGILSNTAYVPAITVGENITIIRPQRVTNSLTPLRQSFGFEKRITRTLGTFLGVTATDVAPTIDFSQFYAILPTRLQLQGTGDSPITGQLSFQASRETDSSAASGAATVLGGTSNYEATRIFQGINCVKKMRMYVAGLSGVAGDAGKIQDTLRFCPQSIQIELANGLTATPLMCAQPEKDYQFGEPLLSVQSTAIYENPFARVVFNQQFDAVFELAIVADDGEGYLFRSPRAKVQIARNDTPGRRQTIQTALTIKAFKQTATPLAGDSSRAVEVYRFRQP